MTLAPHQLQTHQAQHTFSQEVYGFTRFISAITAFAIYLIFAFTPNRVFDKYNIVLYPSLYWFLAIPSLIIFAAIGLILNYIAFNFKNTHSPYHNDVFLRDNLSRRVRLEDVHDSHVLYAENILPLLKLAEPLANLPPRSSHSDDVVSIYRAHNIDPSQINAINERPILESYDLAPTLMTHYFNR